MSFLAALSLATGIYIAVFASLTCRQTPMFGCAFIVTGLYVGAIFGLSFCRWPA